MNVKELKEWLCQYKDEDEIRVYVEVAHILGSD